VVVVFILYQQRNDGNGEYKRFQESFHPSC